MKRKKNEVSDVIALRGCLEVAMHDAFTGAEVARRTIRNTVVTQGRAWVLNRIQSNSPSTNTIGWMAVGSGTVAPATTDVQLGSEIDRNAIGTLDLTGTTAATPYWQAVVSWNTNEANTTLSEVGLFNKASASTLLSRATFSTLNKATSNTLTITYTISN